MFSRGSVLIVEDSWDQARLLQMRLELEAIPSEIAGTLEAALKRLKAGGIICIILDLTLPGVTGVTAVQKLQHDFPPVPIVVYTGDAKLEEGALEAGAQEVVLKGGDEERIIQFVKTAIIRHRVRQKFQPVAEILESAKATVDEALSQIKAAEQGKPAGTPAGTGG